jgi:probable rRNA maturation factor
MINFNINETYEGLIDTARFEATANTVLAAMQQAASTELTIAVEDDDYLQSLNLQFLGIDAPTDVLSFPAGEVDPESGNLYLGDIILSLPRATQQAQTAKHPVENELQLLIIHGILHLLGYDHTTPEMKAEMWTLQARLLEQLAIHINKLPED